MSWLVWHEESEKLASEAHVSVRRGEREQAKRLFAKAAEAESNALLALDRSKTRTFGITAVSAVSLRYKANHVLEAEKLALQCLASNELPAFATEQIRTLLQTIWAELAMHAAGLSFLPGQVLVSVKGGQTIPGGAPLDLIVEKVQTVQALFFRTIEFLKGIPHRKRGAPSLDIQEACRPWLLQTAPGSYQFAVAVQEPRQPDFFKDAGPQAEEVAHHFLAILKASSEDPASELPKLVPAKDYRSTFLKLARNLAPTGKNFSQIEVRSTDDIKGGVSLGPENRKSINQVLRPPQTHFEVDAEPEIELRGILRGLHLEKDWLELLIEGQIVHVDELPEAVDDVIGPMVNRPVKVQARRTKKDRYRFTDIETDD